MSMQMGPVERLANHPNLSEVVGVLAQLAHVTDDDLTRLAQAWTNNVAVAEARDRALSPDVPLVCDALVAFDWVSALFADDLAGEAPYVAVPPETTVVALKAVRDAIAAAYARPVLRRSEHDLLIRPWRTVYPEATVDEPDYGPHADQVKALLRVLPRLAQRCHDSTGRALFDALVDRSFVAESERADAAESAFAAAVLTSRRRVWALVRRSVAEGLSRPCRSCGHEPERAPESVREQQRVVALCVDAACALVVADAVPDAVTDVLTQPVATVIPLQRRPGPST